MARLIGRAAELEGKVERYPNTRGADDRPPLFRAPDARLEEGSEGLALARRPVRARRHPAVNRSRGVGEMKKLPEEKGSVMTDQAHASARVSRYSQTRPDTDDAGRPQRGGFVHPGPWSWWTVRSSTAAPLSSEPGARLRSGTRVQRGVAGHLCGGDQARGAPNKGKPPELANSFRCRADIVGEHRVSSALTPCDTGVRLGVTLGDMGVRG